ncbi:UDP-N-acetylmuramoyl-L-alanine--D-glutamate ligase [bacterium]|jgi:UDP-N-acetylmuramoylalanine--D-glutamate ligase|nr:UDP-N-acetylmuramoyl-L-alanine--D-glutamate ligase [bacterium]MBT6293792.1 UDP-N-acetylmuramoyl-L-alanine--D-glutamate ligase [bacterium]
MNLHDFKKIGIIGFAREGKSLLRFLEKIDFKGEVFVMDTDISIDYPDTLLNVSMLLGKTYLDSICDLDLVFKSSGVPSNLPKILDAKKNGVKFSNQINLFFSLNKKPVIAVSGTKGKSSTVTFIDNVLKIADIKSQLIGNIGNPAIDYLYDDIDYYVFEISSYMLEDFEGEIDYGIFTSFFPDHMDVHGSYENYKNAKFRFFDVCKKLVINDQNQDLKNHLIENDISYTPFDSCKVKFSNNTLHYLGASYSYQNNLGLEIQSNFKGAIEFLLDTGISLNYILKGIETFKKLPFRQEIYKAKKGVIFVNDSASITPESTIAAINNFKDNLNVLILGGQDRGYDYSMLNKLITDLQIPNVFVLPDLDSVGFSFDYKVCPNLEFLTDCLRDLNLESGVVLFSPGGPSYNFYKNFHDRGDCFFKEISKRFPL